MDSFQKFSVEFIQIFKRITEIENENENPNKRKKNSNIFVSKIEEFIDLIHLQKSKLNLKMIKILLEFIDLVQLSCLINLLTDRYQDAYETLIILGTEQLLIPFKKVFISEEILINQLISNNLFLLGIASKLLNMNEPETFFQESLKFNPKFTASKYFLALFLYQTQKYNEALGYLQDIISINDIFIPESLNAIACIYSKQSNHIKALDYFQQSVQLKLSDDVIYNLAIEYQIIKDTFSHLKMLVFLFKNLKKPDEDSLSKLSTIEYSQIEILYDLAKISLSEKKLDYSVSCFEKVISSLKDDSIWGIIKDPPVKIYQYYIEALLEIQDYEKAIDVCDKLIQQTKNMNIMLHKSDALFCLEKIDESLKIIEEVIEISNKENDENTLSIAHNNKGVILLCSNKLNEALICFGYPSHSLEVKFNQCNLLLQMQKYTESCIIWLKSRNIKLDQNNSYYMAIYDSAKLESGKLDKESIESHVSGSLSLNQIFIMDMRILEFKMAMKDEKFMVIAERIL